MTDRSPRDLTETYGPELVRFVLQQVGSTEAASKIVADSFLALNAQEGVVRHPKGFLFRTAHELAIEHLRAQGRYNHDLEDIAKFSMEIATPRARGGAPSSISSSSSAVKDVPLEKDASSAQGVLPLGSGALEDVRRDALEEAILALPTRRMKMFFDRKTHGRSLKSIAASLGSDRATTAREIAIAASTVYLQLNPSYPTAPQEQERLLNAFGWRIRTRRKQGEDAAPTPEGMASWLRADPANEQVYAVAAAFWDDPELRHACERVERRIRKIEEPKKKIRKESGSVWGPILVLVGFAALGAGIAWLYPEIFDRLLTLLQITA